MKAVEQTFRLNNVGVPCSEQFLEVLAFKQLCRLRYLRIYLAIKRYEIKGCFDEPAVYMVTIDKNGKSDLYRTKEHMH